MKSASVSVPLVSFLTTVYGTEDSLSATIESVLAQTSPDWEMVVVDNGLSPRVVEIVSNYAHHGRIRLIRQENRGYRGGVTAAAETATGRYLSVLDSDDKIMPSFVSAMTDVVAAEPGIDAVGCDAVQFDDSEQAHLPARYLASLGVQWQPRYASQPLTLSDALAGVIPYYTGIVRRDAWQQVGGYAAHDPDVDESVMIWLRLVQLCDVRLIDAPLGWYRIRSDSLSRDPAKREAFEQALIAAFSRTALTHRIRQGPGHRRGHGRQGFGTTRSCGGLGGHCWTETFGRLADTRDSPSPIIQDCARAWWLHRWPSRPRCCSGSTRTSSERLPLGYESANAGLPDGAASAEGRPRRSDDPALEDTVLPPRPYSKAPVIAHVMNEGAMARLRRVTLSWSHSNGGTWWLRASVGWSAIRVDTHRWVSRTCAVIHPDPGWQTR